MPTYYVDIPEIWYYRYQIEADNKDEAIKLILSDGNPVNDRSGDYDQNLEPDVAFWYIEGPNEEYDRWDGNEWRSMIGPTEEEHD